MEYDGEKQGGREERGEGTAGWERIEAEPKVYAWPTEKEKLSTSLLSKHEFFLSGDGKSYMEDKLNDDEKTTREKN